MTQQEKQLVLKDLCARLPYGVMVHLVYDDDVSFERELGIGSLHDIMFDNVVDAKPYLRPISSMTDKEKEEFKDTFNGFFQYFNHGIISDSRVYDKNEAVYVGELSCSRLIDWLNAHHFDYRRLIPMGLALEAPEDMYKTV